MGQQQLLLVILVTILVGIATVVAINVFTESQEQANKEAVITDMLTAIPDARAYYKKPSALGGGSGSFANINLDDMILTQENENGSYEISDRNGSSFTLTGTPASGIDPVVLIVYPDSIQWQED